MTGHISLGVHPTTIMFERLRGWTSFHPEDYCHRCGCRNVHAWHAPNLDWNEIRDQIRADAPSEIICPQCFTEIYQAAHPGEHPVWEIRRERYENPNRPLIDKIQETLDSNPHASNAFLAGKIAALTEGLG